MIQKMYQAFYVSRVSWASESVEKKTISAKSGFTLKIMFGILTINRPNEHSMFMDPVTPIDVHTATSKIKTKTSKDHDGISTKLV